MSREAMCAMMYVGTVRNWLLDRNNEVFAGSAFSTNEDGMRTMNAPYPIDVDDHLFVEELAQRLVDATDAVAEIKMHEQTFEVILHRGF